MATLIAACWQRYILHYGLLREVKEGNMNVALSVRTRFCCVLISVKNKDF